MVDRRSGKFESQLVGSIKRRPLGSGTPGGNLGERVVREMVSIPGQRRGIRLAQNVCRWSRHPLGSHAASSAWKCSRPYCSLCRNVRGKVVDRQGRFPALRHNTNLEAIYQDLNVPGRPISDARSGTSKESQIFCQHFVCGDNPVRRN